MSNLVLDVYGVSVEISGSESVLANLKADFGHFVAAHAKKTELVFEIKQVPAPASLVPAGRGIFQTRMCGVHGWGAHRVCDYGRNALVVSENGREQRKFRIFAPDGDDLYEISYTAVLSAVGEALDLRGYHRVHALGIEFGKLRGIVILPQGAGKSAMAALLKDDPEVKIFSDETPLLKGTKLYPYPVRMALHPSVARALGLPESARVFKRRIFAEKALYSLEGSQVAAPAKIDFVACGSLARAQKQPELRRSNAATAFYAMVKHMVIGIGVAQMAEHMLRAGSLPRLGKIALLRALTAWRVSLAADCFEFRVGPDARENARLLREIQSR